MGLDLPFNISKLFKKGQKYTKIGQFLLNLPIELKPSLAPLVPRCLSFCDPDLQYCFPMQLGVALITGPMEPFS